MISPPSYGYVQTYYQLWQQVATWEPQIVLSVPTPDELSHIAKHPTERWAAILQDISVEEPVAFNTPVCRILWIGGGDRRVALPTLVNFSRFVAWLRLIYEFPEPIRLFYWDIDIPREGPTHGVLGPKHVNGGASYSCSGRAVNVFRREEAEKVLLHELVHAMCGDVDTETIDLTMETLIGVTETLRLPEAFTECMAEFYYIASKFGDSEADFNTAWQTQYKHAITLTSNILHYMKRTSPLDRKQPWKEDTAVFSYYIMKTILLKHIDTVLEQPQQSVIMWPIWLVEFEKSWKRQRKGKQTKKKNSARRNTVRKLRLRMVAPEITN